jgi:hypothetical protein
MATLAGVSSYPSRRNWLTPPGISPTIPCPAGPVQRSQQYAAPFQLPWLQYSADELGKCLLQAHRSYVTQLALPRLMPQDSRAVVRSVLSAAPDSGR